MKDPGSDERRPRIAAAAERNKDAILEKLKEIFPANQPLQAIEIASGTGQHVAHFAQALPNVQWQPSDIDPSHIQSISAFIETLGLRNVRPPIIANVLEPVSDWSDGIPEKKNFFDVVLCSNMIHISPWSCTLGLFAGASQLLKPMGLLITYGPYAVDGVLTPESNVVFNQYLQSENPEWGVRDVRDITEVGTKNGLKFRRSIDMPANNKILVFQKE